MLLVAIPEQLAHDRGITVDKRSAQDFEDNLFVGAGHATSVVVRRCGMLRQKAAASASEDRNAAACRVKDPG